MAADLQCGTGTVDQEAKTERNVHAELVQNGIVALIFLVLYVIGVRTYFLGLELVRAFSLSESMVYIRDIAVLMFFLGGFMELENEVWFEYLSDIRIWCAYLLTPATDMR